MAKLLLQGGSVLLLQGGNALLLQGTSGPAPPTPGPYLERDAIRIIPLITSDSGATWRPRGT